MYINPFGFKSLVKLINAFLSSFMCSITFNAKTPIQLYKLILPDVLTKGKDYKIKEVVGAKEIISNGGKVKLIDIYKNLSSTKLLKNI